MFHEELSMGCRADCGTRRRVHITDFHSDEESHARNALTVLQLLLSQYKWYYRTRAELEQTKSKQNFYIPDDFGNQGHGRLNTDSSRNSQNSREAWNN